MLFTDSYVKVIVSSPSCVHLDSDDQVKTEACIDNLNHIQTLDIFVREKRDRQIGSQTDKRTKTDRQTEWQISEEKRTE